MSRETTWTNSDGLVVGFGTHSEDNNVSAVTQGANGIQTLSAEFDLADLADAFAATNINPQDATIPRGSVVTSAFVHTLVTPTSAATNAELDIGMWSKGKATEEVDVANGLLEAATIAELDIIGSAIRCDGAYVADGPTAASTQYAVGAVAEADCVIAPSYDVEAFTAGKIRVVVNFLPPSGSSGRTLAAVN